MADERKIERTVRKETKTTVTLRAAEYEGILREAIGAPITAHVEIEDTYGGDITISWTDVENE